MAKGSQDVMKRRWDRWSQIEATLTAYALMADDESERTNNVVVPVSYATLDTLLTYWLSTAAAGPIFRYTGVGPEDKEKAMLMELVIDLQCKRMKTLLGLHTMWRDSIAFGIGVSAVRWRREYGRKVITTKNPIMGLTGEVLGYDTQKVKKRAVVFEGNALDNVSVFNYLPDPNVPAHDVQRFEFVGIQGVDSYTNLLGVEGEAPEEWFNVRYLKGQANRSILEYRVPMGEEKRIGENVVFGTQQVDLLTMYVNLVPRDWKLGKKRYPEKWVFVVAGNGVLIRCQPLNLDHNRFPVAVCCPTYDGYSVSPISTLEMVYGIQEWVDWCYRSNVDNVKKMLHNMLIIDPFLVNYDSVVNSPGPGMVATIRSHVWGRGVENAMKQLEMRDVTSPTLGYVNNSIELIQRVAGSTDSLQGIVQQGGERRTATEMRDARMSALGRVQKGARLASIQCMQDLGYLYAKHLQQHMDTKMFVQLIGEHQVELQQIYNGVTYAEVGPDLLADVDFDLVVSDGSNPGGEFLTDLIQMYQIVRGDPETAKAFDPVRMVLDMYIRANVKGASRFLRVQTPPNMNVMPDEQAMNVVAGAPNAQPVNSVDIAAMGMRANDTAV
jgi:hypothetical protein